MFNSAFDPITGSSLDFYPKHLRGGIDTINEAVYRRVNNGVYKAGFATTQEAYEEAYDALFAARDDLEQRLARQDRKSVVEGKSVSVSVDLGGRRIIQKKN